MEIASSSPITGNAPHQNVLPMVERRCVLVRSYIREPFESSLGRIQQRFQIGFAIADNELWGWCPVFAQIRSGKYLFVFNFVSVIDNDLIWLWLKNNKAEHVFPLGDDPKNGVPPFPMPYDLPLLPYTPDDTPFVMDYLLDTMK